MQFSMVFLTTVNDCPRTVGKNSGFYLNFEIIDKNIEIDSSDALSVDTIFYYTILNRKPLTYPMQINRT